MEYQLIISRKEKFNNIAYPKDAMERFIIDYTELSSMHLKKQKCFLYRVLSAERVLEGEELMRIFRTLVKKEKACYYLDTDEFIQDESRSQQDIEGQIMNFVGVLYENYV